MEVKFVQDEDFLNYKEPSMFIGFPYCNFKCERENPKCHCQNSPLALAPIIMISDEKIIQRYMSNNITRAIVFGGLEPLDSFTELVGFINKFRAESDDEIVIYTGYNKEEIAAQIEVLRQYKNIIIKFGRFIPDVQGRYDEVLGITLASDNQYAERIS